MTGWHLLALLVVLAVVGRLTNNTHSLLSYLLNNYICFTRKTGLMKSLNLKMIMLVSCMCFLAATAEGQDTIQFYNVIKDDSVVLYFNKSFSFTEERCAEYRRYTNVDSNGNFHQSFTDINKQDVVIGKGYYEHGLKNGEFETFYPDGQLQSRGRYRNNTATGSWIFFYPNGKPDRVLLINVADTLLLQFYDTSGVRRVTDGKGFFNGEVAAANATAYNKVVAYGGIVDGKPDGEWKSFFGTYPYCTEKFDKGVFISGEQKSMAKGTIQYKTNSRLKDLFPISYIERLEQFNIVKCWNFTSIADIPGDKPKRNVNLEINLESFRSFVNDAVRRVLETDGRNGYSDYVDGDNFFKISFRVNDKGTPVDFKKLTSWGDQYFYPISDAMTMHAKLPTSDKPLYFQLTIIKKEGNTISYRYNFTFD